MDALPARSEEALKRQYENNREGRSEHSKLSEQIVYPKPKENWPTPTANQWKGARSPEGLKEAGRNETNSLCDAVRAWPTPRANSAMAAKINPDAKFPNLETVVAKTGETGHLNPEFVEWLMGFPKNWSHLDKEPDEDSLKYCWSEEFPDTPRVTTEKKYRKDRLKCLGNALIPKIPQLIARLINENS